MRRRDLEAITLPTQVVVSGYWVFAEELTAERLESELAFQDRVDYMIYYANDCGDVTPIMFVHAGESSHTCTPIQRSLNND